MKGLYIHIPFCKSICSYCDFPKIIAKKDIHIAYMDKLLEEIDFYCDELKDIDTIYIGGGTPNCVDLSLLEKLFKHIKKYIKKDMEISIELNPELITKDLVSLLRQYKVNRVSLGVQTINEQALQLLNRHHTKNSVIEAIKLLQLNEIENINVDFMFGIPNTTLEDVEKDLDFILSLPITHISYYSLILEDKTVLKYKIDKNEVKLLDDDLVADMYDYICNRLSNDFHHYEISNFAKNGYESKHNLIYWNCDSYIGVGSSACGYIHNYRYQNHRIIQNYMKYRIEEKEEISLKESKNEFFMLGLRMVDGVSKKRYYEKFNSNVEDDFDLSNLIQKGLLEVYKDNIKIPKDKLFVANLVFMEFVGD